MIIVVKLKIHPFKNFALEAIGRGGFFILFIWLLCFTILTHTNLGFVKCLVKLGGLWTRQSKREKVSRPSSTFKTLSPSDVMLGWVEVIFGPTQNIVLVRFVTWRNHIKLATLIQPKLFYIWIGLDRVESLVVELFFSQ